PGRGRVGRVEVGHVQIVGHVLTLPARGVEAQTSGGRGGRSGGMHERAGTRALPEDLIDVDAVTGAYYDRAPDLEDPAQQVVFGTSGHRGSSLDGAFNEAHIIATTAAIV